MDFRRAGGRLVAAIFFCIAFERADAAAAPPLSAYGALPRTEELALSPNGEMFARISTEGDNRLLIVEKVSGGLVMASNVGDLKIADIAWASDDHVIVYTRRTDSLGFGYDQHEFLQGVVANVRRQQVSPLLRRSDRYLSAVFGHYGFGMEDGEWHAYIGVIPLNHDNKTGNSWLKQGYPDLYKVGLDSGNLRRVARGGSYRDWVLDEKGQILAQSEYDGRDGAWKVMPPDSSAPIASGQALHGFSLIGLGRTPGTVLVNPENEDGGRLVELSLADGRQTEILPENSVADLVFSDRSRLLIGAVIAGERQRTVMFDPALSRRMQSIEKAFGAASLSRAAVSADHSKILVYAESGGTTGTWQLVDFDTMHATPLADAYTGIPNDAVGKVEVIEYRAGDGLTIRGILTLPSGSRANLPLVVLPHGGPEAMDVVGFDWWAQAFASRGYAVFQPNFRGSSGRGAAFRNAGFGEWGRKMQTDISDGVTALASRGIIDPLRVCIVGGSYGGYAALAGVTLQRGLYRCAASYAGVSDPAGMLSFTADKYGRKHKDPAMRYWRSYFGIGENDYRVADEISPLARAAEADAPILLIHGKDDTVVPIDQSERMASALRRAGKPVELVTLKGEDHWLSRSATRLAMLEAMMAFVQKHLPAETLAAR